MSDWGAAVIARYGNSCVMCGHTGYVELDHIWPKSQGRKDPRVLDERNGAPVCGDFCPYCKREKRRPCHQAKTRGEVRYDPRLLLPDTLQFLADVGWVSFDPEGHSQGVGWRHFKDLPVMGRRREGWRR